VLSLVAGALPKSERRAVKRALREARRALSPARDQVVAPHTLGGLPLDDAERATAKQIVDAAFEAAQPIAEIKQLLAEGAARAAAQVEALEAALPPTISWDVVARGLRDVYDDARCARKSAKRSKRAFHAWRRRSKELGYQLEILATYAGPQVDELRQELVGAIEPQSSAVDLVMVRDFIRTFGQGTDAEACERLINAIDTQLDDLMKAARKSGKDAFKRAPRRFERRLTKAVRRDLAPPPADAVA
jgi:CHAD domain-containing protein